MDGKLNVNQQSALAAMKTQHALVCVSNSTASKLRKVTVTINLGLRRLNLSSRVQDRQHPTEASPVEGLD